MIINDIYTAISTALLRQVPAVPPATGLVTATPARMVDWYNGQPERLESGEPDTDVVLFPLVLVRYEPPQWRGNSRRGYYAQLTVYVDVVQWPDGRMANDVPVDELARTRGTYAHVHQITKALVALTGPGFGPFKLITTVLDHNFRKLRVETAAFRTLVKTDMDPAQWQRVQPALADSYSMG